MKYMNDDEHTLGLLCSVFVPVSESLAGVVAVD